MGLPQHQEPATSSRAPSQTSSNAQAASRQLPPEAVDLANKLFDFAREGKTANLAQYITAGIPVNLTNHKGDTLLMLAAYHGQAETLKMLVERGADVNSLNDRGQGPIAGAVFKGHDEVVRILADGGADVRAGQPNAVDSAKMFRRDEYLRLFGVQDEPNDVPGMIPPRPS
nr:putative ankyrin repeat protein [Quercus suber]